MKKLSIIFLWITLLVISFNCKDTITGEDIDSRVIPDSDVSYKTNLQPVFEIKCNVTGCHDDESRAAGISLTSYQNITSDLSVVFPGQPQNSRLAVAIQVSTSIPMPPAGYPPLTANQITGIITWIKEGAKNN